MAAPTRSPSSSAAWYARSPAAWRSSGRPSMWAAIARRRRSSKPSDAETFGSESRANACDQCWLTKLDPRVLLSWYSYFAIIPWFIHSHVILTGYLLFMVFLTYKAKVSPLILGVLGLGLLGEMAILFIISLFFGGNIETVLPMFWLSIKLGSISLASVAVFTSLNPEKFSDALLRMGFPAQFSFSVAYGYRILPTLLEEFQQIILSYRLRGQAPAKKWDRILAKDCLFS